MAGRRSLEEIERDFLEARQRGDGLPDHVWSRLWPDDAGSAGAAAGTGSSSQRQDRPVNARSG